jgi:transcriptional regulator with XRE-family HTH domain
MADRLQALFGRRLRQLRHERGLSQADLAELADVTPEYVSRIERGRVGPSMDVIATLAQVLGVEPRDLFDFGERAAARDTAAARVYDVASRGTAEQRRLILRIAETIVAARRKGASR